MELIIQSLNKARQSLTEEELLNLNRTIKLYLRSTLSSIYLIKISEHKMLEG